MGHAGLTREWIEYWEWECLQTLFIDTGIIEYSEPAKYLLHVKA